MPISLEVCKAIRVIFYICIFEKNIFAGYVEHSIKRRKNLFFCQPEHLLLLQV